MQINVNLITGDTICNWLIKIHNDVKNLYNLIVQIVNLKYSAQIWSTPLRSEVPRLDLSSTPLKIKLGKLKQLYSRLTSTNEVYYDSTRRALKKLG